MAHCCHQKVDLASTLTGSTIVALFLLHYLNQLLIFSLDQLPISSLDKDDKEETRFIVDTMGDPDSQADFFLFENEVNDCDRQRFDSESDCDCGGFLSESDKYYGGGTRN